MMFRRKRLRPMLLILLSIVIVAEIVALSPTPLEDVKAPNLAVDPDTLVQEHEQTLAPGIPSKRIAEYTVEKFQYVSVQNGNKQWRILADKAFMYNPERLVHSRTVTAYLYDPDNQVTITTGQEAKYYLNQKDLEMYGNVKTVFPDGFVVYSEYMRYLPNERRVKIPTQYAVSGTSDDSEGQNFHFESHGLDYQMDTSEVYLPKDAKVILERRAPKTAESQGVPDVTRIESDHCLILRSKKLAKFTMDPKRPLNQRFVHITQPSLFARSRRADLNYGDFSEVLQYLVAFEDVLIKETENKDLKKPEKKPAMPNKPAKEDLRYATGGRADFDTRRDVIVLTQFPQAYQNEDTVTGDVILMHRDTDVIEVENSNAFSTGSD